MGNAMITLNLDVTEAYELRNHLDILGDTDFWRFSEPNNDLDPIFDTLQYMVKTLGAKPRDGIYQLPLYGKQGSVLYMTLGETAGKNLTLWGIEDSLNEIFG